MFEHKKERDKRVCDRIKAILLYDKGWTLMQITEALLLSDDAIRQHIKDYKASLKLKSENCPLGQDFASRIRGKFRAIGVPISDF